MILYSLTTCVTFRPLEPSFADWVVETSMNILNCRIDKLSQHNLACIQMEITHPLLRKCNVKKEGNHTECLQQVRKKCLRSKIRAFKTIRMPMEIIERIIKIDPSVKIIYSTRDPRGMINSRRNLERFPDRKFGMEVKSLCIHVEHDYKLFLNNTLLRKHTCKLDYDKLVSDLLGQTKSIYHYLGINITNNSIMLKRMSQLDRTKRLNATSPIPKWRNTLTSEQVEIVNMECTWLLETLGYNKHDGF